MGTEIIKDEDEIVEVKKSDLKAIVKEGIEKQLEARGAVVDENLKAVAREVAEEVYNSHKDNAKKAILFTPADDPKGGFKSANQFYGDVIANGESGGRVMSKELIAWEKLCDERKKTAGSPAQGTTSGETGGFLVPQEYRMNILERQSEKSNIINKTQIIPMSSNSVVIPYVNGFNESQGKVGGNISFTFVGETTDRSTGKNIDFGGVTLTLREASCMVYLNNSLIKFSPVSIESFVTRVLDQALDFTLSEKFIDGTGAGQPMGIMNAPCLVSVAKEAEQSADTIEIENILKMFSRHYGNNKEWYANLDTLPQIATMVIAGGGTSTPVFMPAGGATGKLSDTLLGRPINWNDHAKTIGDAGDIILTDWSEYLVGQFAGDNGTMEVAESIHVKFDYNQKALRFTFYIDGQPWWASAFTPKNSVNTRSPFVVAAAR